MYIEQSNNAFSKNGENKMITKNRMEIIEELAFNVEVAFKSYGTWIVKSKALGVPASFLTHDEEWLTGKYEPREERDRRAAEALFDVWVYDEKVEENEEGNFYISEVL